VTTDLRNRGGVQALDLATDGTQMIAARCHNGFAVMVADGGGLAPAVRHPVEGRERVVALLSRFSQLAPGAAVATLLVNGSVAARIDIEQRNVVVTFLVEDGRIARIYGMLNPHKLGRLEKVAELRR
jgi:hypothetical protein